MVTTAIRRLQKDYLDLVNHPLPYITAKPDPHNMLKWHFVIKGAPDTPYEGGYYHGVLKFSPCFPFKPPSIVMQTPSGRFAIRESICLSMTDFHAESWIPSWSVSTILLGFQSFMNEETRTFGSVNSSPQQRCLLAKASLAYNLKDKEFCKIFPEISEELRKAVGNKINAKEAKKPATDATEADGTESDVAETEGEDENKTSLQHKFEAKWYAKFIIALIVFTIYLAICWK